MGWFPCAAAVLGSPNAQGKPAQHIHLPLGGRTLAGAAAGRGKARRGGRDDGRGPIGSPEGRGGVAAASLGLVAPRDPPGAIGRARVLRLSIADSGLRS